MALRAAIVSPAARHGVAGIDGQVEQREFERAEVGFQRPDIGGNVYPELDVLAQALADQLTQALGLPQQIDPFGVQRLSAGECQQPPRQLRCAPGGLLGAAQRPFPQPRVARLGEHLQPIDDHHQEVVEIVRDPAGQLADRVEFLHLEQLSLRLDARRRLGLHLALQIGIDPFQLGV